MSIEILYLSLNTKDCFPTWTKFWKQLKFRREGALRNNAYVRSPNKGHATRWTILFPQRASDIILHTSLSDKSIYYCSCAKNIAVMFIERNCPTLSQTSSIKLSYIKCGILHFLNIGDCIKEYCNMTSRFACGILAVVYKRNIPPVWNDVKWYGVIVHQVSVVYAWFITVTVLGGR